MPHPWRPIAVAMLLLTLACRPGAAPVDRAGVEAAIRDLAGAAARYDFQTVRSLYEEGGTWIEMGTEPLGLDSLERRTFPMQALGVRAEWAPTDIRVAGEGRVAWATWCWCPATFRVETETAADVMRQIFGTEDPTQRKWQLDMMVSAVLRKHGDQWLFVQGHVSPRERPVD